MPRARAVEDKSPNPRNVVYPGDKTPSSELLQHIYNSLEFSYPAPNFETLQFDLGSVQERLANKAGTQKVLDDMHKSFGRALGSHAAVHPRRASRIQLNQPHTNP
jgi:hypothetical protein